MTFLHKLAQRLARIRTALLIGIVTTMACEVPVADPSSSVGRLQLSPKAPALRAGQTTQFTVVALTPTGDTAIVDVRWTITGGSMVDTSTSGGKHYLQYRSPSEPGQYKVVTTSTVDGISDSAVVTVGAVTVASVSMNPTATTLTALETVQLTAFAMDSVGDALTDRVVTWASNDSAIATVSAIGLVTGVSDGTATVTATSEGKSATAAVTVEPMPLAPVGVSQAAVSVMIGQTVQLAATRVVTWGSGNTAVATVSGSGLVTGVAVGATVITATSRGKRVTTAVTVTPTSTLVASVAVNPASANLSTGQAVQLTATPLDASGNVLVGRVVTWSSGNAARATVSANGLVTGVTAGTVTITATSEGQSGSSAITVTTPVAPVASVTVSPAAPSIGPGQTVQLTATPRSVSGALLTGRVVTWTSGNTGIATVAGAGLVTGVTAGTVTVTATSEGIGGNASVTVTAAPPPPPPPTGGTWPNQPAGYTTITDYAFNDAVPTSGDTPVGSGWSATNPNGRVSRITDGTAPQSASNVMEWHFPAGFTGGNYPGQFYYPASGTKSHYVGYWFKYSDPFDMGPGNKQWYPYSTNANFFMSVTSSWKIKMEVQAGAGYGGTYNLFANVSDPTITRGVWHRMEILQVYPSTSSTNNGVFKWWIDGVLCGNYTNVGWNTSASYQELRLSPVWGSFSSDVVAYSGRWWVDHIHVSKP